MHACVCGECTTAGDCGWRESKCERECLTLAILGYSAIEGKAGSWVQGLHMTTYTCWSCCVSGTAPAVASNSSSPAVILKASLCGLFKPQLPPPPFLLPPRLPGSWKSWQASGWGGLRGQACPAAPSTTSSRCSPNHRSVPTVLWLTRPPSQFHLRLTPSSLLF